MPGSPSQCYTHVWHQQNHRMGGQHWGAWPWGLASWHPQRAATATAAASSGLNACWCAALNRMLLCLALRQGVAHL